jgi:thiol-disulfide isomerase/thioredoxin
MKNLKLIVILTFLLSFTFFANAQETKTGIEIGNIAPDIMLPNPDGDTIALSSLRGQVVLIDFWAGWCGPCRRENPVVLEAYNKFKDKRFTIGKGFNVFGVSIDKNRETWLDAIKSDQLPWNQVSDLLYWQSPYIRLYNVRGIPANFLIDKDGVIIAKNLRGEKLTETLNAYIVKDPVDELMRLTQEMNETIILLNQDENYKQFEKESEKILKQIEKLAAEIEALKAQKQ